jgi:voltage-gated potassium channel
MTFVLARLVRRLGHGRTWTLPLLIIAGVFVTSWPLMAWAEPSSNAIAAPGNYWWWFVVTAATVGYGDFFPTTTGGHLVGVYVIVGGIVTLTTLFTRIATAIDTAKGRRMKGQAELDMSEHLVVLGYTPGRTERMLEELTAEGAWQTALCAWEDLAENPVPNLPDVGFVRGDLTDEAVLRRAGLHRAARVLVDARDDNEALALTVAANHLNPDAHTVVTLRDMTAARNLSYVDADVHAVQWHSPRMVAEELLDPGIAQVYADLMTHGGRNTYSARVPEPVAGTRFGDIQSALGRDHASTVIAVRHDGQMLDPDWDTGLDAGAVLYYVGTRRLTEDDIARSVSSR